MRFRVAVPKMDKSEFNLKGQMLNFSLPLTDAVSGQNYRKNTKNWDILKNYSNFKKKRDILVL